MVHEDSGGLSGLHRVVVDVKRCDCNRGLVRDWGRDAVREENLGSERGGGEGYYCDRGLERSQYWDVVVHV